MKFVAKVVSAAILITSGVAQAAVPTCTNSTCSITASGSYVLDSNVYFSLTISANNVVLDLNGSQISQNSWATNNVCAVVWGQRGNACTGAAGGSAAITVTGANVIIKNGIVSSGGGNGIVINAPAINVNQNVTLKDLTVNNFVGYGILMNVDGVTLENVRADQNGKGGILGAAGGYLAKDVRADYNNGVGIQLGNNSVLENATAQYNTSTGIWTQTGPITRATSSHNGYHGVFAAGTVRDVYALGNVHDGINLTGGFGVVLDSVSTQNSGIGVNMASGTCYAHLSSTGNTGAQISGGTALAGNVTSCP